MRSSRWFGRAVLAAGLLGGVLLQTELLWAQDPNDRNVAVQKFQRGLELEQAQDFAGALQVFRDVGQFKMTPQVRFHIALCEAQLGKLVAALGGYELALHDAQSVGPDFESEVTTKVEELRARIPKLTIMRGRGADAAAISLDGVELGAARIGTEIPLDPGPHTLAARAPSFKPYQTTVVLQESNPLTATIDLEPLVVEAPPPEPLPPPPAVVEKSKPLPLPPLILGGAGVALLATSGVTFILYSNGLKALDEAKTQAEYNSRLDDVRPYNVVAPLTLGLGLAALGGGALWFYLDQHSEHRTTDSAQNPRLRLGLGAPNATSGLTLDGRF